MITMPFKTMFASFILLMSTSAFAQTALKTVPFVDVSRYLTTWYQISHNPMIFEGVCVCARQVLSAGANGNVAVYNSCNDKTINGPIRDIRGTAVSEDPATNARFTVDFGLPHKGEYWIIGLDPQYRYAVVSDPSKKSLYILSQTPTLPPDLYQAAFAEAAAQVDTSHLEVTTQAGCTYP